MRVQRTIVEVVVGTCPEEPGGGLAAPDAVHPETVGGAPQLEEADPERLDPEQAAPSDGSLGAISEVVLQALVGIEREDPFGPVGECGRDECPVVPDLVPALAGFRSAEYLDDGGVRPEQVGASVARAVVERDDGFDLRWDVAQPPGDEAGVVPDGDRGEHPGGAGCSPPSAGGERDHDRRSPMRRRRRRSGAPAPRSRTRAALPSIILGTTSSRVSSSQSLRTVASVGAGCR